MKVVISVGGRFHAFYLAQQLLKRGYLNKLVTSYPKFEAAKYGIPKNKVGSVIIKELMFRPWQRFPLWLKNLYNPHFLINEVYDKWASHLCPRGDICVAFSSFALHTIRKAKDMGTKTILERGSSHILYQAEILKEEYEKYGFKPQSVHPKIVEKELQEYEEADYISVPSIFAKKTFLNSGYPEEKLIHVPYGVDLVDFNLVPKEDGIFRIIHCGEIDLQKGAHYLLRAFYELNLPDTELWLIGRMSEEMRPFLRKYDNGKIFHKGTYPQNELHKYYSQGSVFVLMSIQEGLAMVMPQAMACGLPVICTTNTGGEDIVRDGVDGFIISIRDVKALKEKLTYMYENQSLCKQMGRNARERVRGAFTWDDYGERMIKVYEKILYEKSI
jgi:glycosyltransferase involved in cell wall biosynthesis